MKIFTMSDLHGCLAEFEEALSLVDLSNDDSMLILLGIVFMDRIVMVC